MRRTYCGLAADASTRYPIHIPPQGYSEMATSGDDE